MCGRNNTKVRNIVWKEDVLPDKFEPEFTTSDSVGNNITSCFGVHKSSAQLALHILAAPEKTAWQVPYQFVKLLYGNYHTHL